MSLMAVSKLDTWSSFVAMDVLLKLEPKIRISPKEP